jgi:hypothetical protein
MKDVLVQFQGLETYINFQVWLGNVYDVILGMQLLNLVDAWVMCKCKFSYNTKPDGSLFELTSMQTLFDK